VRHLALSIGDLLKLEKTWGQVEHIFSSPFAALSVLDVKAGGYSSRHYHQHRVNRFYVKSGAIDVVQYDKSGNREVVRRTLRAGDLADVGPNIVHRFEVKEPGIVIEFYFPADLREDDIVRLDVGGCES
jgi:mannose-6-phosphate isomerase-like protein (cupin superfamily)